MNPKTLNECFAELAARRVWYKSIGVDRKIAYRDKTRFEVGELADSKIRFYLSRAGYKLYQPELWIVDDMNHKL
jgi:hypothetical protein